jgi:hypothetical protein
MCNFNDPNSLDPYATLMPNITSKGPMWWFQALFMAPEMWKFHLYAKVFVFLYSPWSRPLDPSRGCKRYLMMPIS